MEMDDLVFNSLDPGIPELRQNVKPYSNKQPGSYTKCRVNVTVEESISRNAESGTNRCGAEEEGLSFANIAEMLKQGPIPSALKS
ncbi:uncharacterized protein LOC121790258 isoform X2 [Salvia splendens]|nr:uncharacterized protein LOC121790258 isoform X2 [Salvia splendens]